MSPKSSTIIGIGNALVDLTFEVPSLSDIDPPLEENSARLLSNKEWGILKSNLKNPINLSPGGSACNTIAGIAALGGDTGFIGVIGHDPIANTIKQDLKNNSIKSYLVQSTNPKEPTGCCIVIITPDGNRTMAACLGASVDLSPDHIPEHVISSAHSIFLEGFLFDKTEARNAFVKASKIAKENNVQVAFSLSDISCVRSNKQEILDLLDYVDLLFGNYLEIQLLTDTNSPKDACKALQDIGINNACVTLDEKGALTLHDNTVEHSPAYAISQTTDLNGAGDGFAAGFLFALSKGIAFHESAKVANIFAAHVVQEHGPRINPNSIGKIRGLLYAMQPRLSM